MPTCRRFSPQNWLLWQRPLTEVHKILAVGNFSSTLLIQQSALRSVHPLSNERGDNLNKENPEHKPAGGIAMVPGGRGLKGISVYSVLLIISLNSFCCSSVKQMLVKNYYLYY